MTDGLTEDHFWSKVDKSGDCWEWTAYKVRGYGKFRFDGESRLAHRVSWMLARGAISAGVELDHACHNPGCVNPSHLRLVNKKQNMENRVGPNRNGASGVRGVTWRPDRQRWLGQVAHNNKRYYAGMHRTLEAAEAAVIAKRNELFTHNNADR